MNLISNLIRLVFLILFLFSSSVFANTLNKIEIKGNDRISNETIKLFISVNIDDKIDDIKLNNILKDLYSTNFFKDISINFENQILSISVVENPIIESISYNGIKSDRILNIVKENTSIKSRSSYNEIILKKEKSKIKNILKNLGYYNSNIDILIKKTKNNLVNVTYDIKLGKKSKIKKITFVGNKIFKDKKLRRVITSTEYKFWKFISGRKYLNENLVLFDERLLKNFYKNNGYYNVKINSSFAKLIDNNTFELIFNIDSGPKIYFGNLDLNLPSDFDEKNFNSIKKLFKKTKGKPYSINTIDKILDAYINKNKSTVILEAGTGVGKSAIAMTVARYITEKFDNTEEEKYSPGSYFLTTQKILQKQYTKDFGKPKGRIQKIARSCPLRWGAPSAPAKIVIGKMNRNNKNIL